MERRPAAARPVCLSRTVPQVVLPPVLVLVAGVLGGCKPSDSVEARATGEKPDSRPNIVWLSIESLRADHIGCYGYERDTTPNLDALAAEGTLFEQAHSVTSWTLTAHASMFTGLYPIAHRVVWPKDRLSGEHTTVAEILAREGYQTAAIVSGPYLQQQHQLDQGFRHYDVNPIRKPGTKARDDVTNPRMEESLRRYLVELREPRKPFFMFAYFWDPHHHYIPPPPYDTMFVPEGAAKIDVEKIRYDPICKLGKHVSQAQLLYLIAQYDGEIRCTDECVGRLWRLLRELGLWDNTAIIVTSDHGEEFFDHGHNSHKNSLYVESLHVPLVIKFPGQRDSGRDSRIVNLIDLFPTIIELAGEDPEPPFSGRSLLAPSPVPGPTFFDLQTLWTFTNRRTKQEWQEKERWLAVRDGRFKLVDIRGDEKTRLELYDVVADPRELHPLGSGHEELIGDLQGRLEEWRQTQEVLARRWEAGGQAKLTAEEEQRLRSLGYLP